MDDKLERHNRRALERQERQARELKRQETNLLHKRLTTILNDLAHYFGYRPSGKMPFTQFITKYQFCTRITSDPSLLSSFAALAGGITPAEAILLMGPLKGRSYENERAADLPYCSPEPTCHLNVQDISTVAKHLALHGFSGTGTPFEALAPESANVLRRVLNHILGVSDCTELSASDVERLTSLWSDGKEKMLMFSDYGFHCYLKQLRESQNLKTHDFIVKIGEWTDDRHWGCMRTIFKQVALEREIKLCEEEEGRQLVGEKQEDVAREREELEEMLKEVKMRVMEYF
ncbi:hypothetical protein DFH27DRAFT_583446 [Peziza echinospora]|nr:hypothetical protein DFH27DRAFT_583446 [Peziza echinospora]